MKVFELDLGWPEDAFYRNDSDDYDYLSVCKETVQHILGASPPLSIKVTFSKCPIKGSHKVIDVTRTCRTYAGKEVTLTCNHISILNKYGYYVKIEPLETDK